MPNYGRWLPDSSAFGGTVSVTPYPVRLGTTYLDAGPIQKPGSITEYDRPKRLSFHHTVQLRRSFLNTDVDAPIRHSFDLKVGGAFVDWRLVHVHSSREFPSGAASSPLWISQGKQPDASRAEAIC